MPRDRVEHLPERDPVRLRQVAGELLVDLGEHHQLRVVHLAVDVHRDKRAGRLLDFGEELAHAGRLPGPRQAVAYRAQGPPAPEARRDEEGELFHLPLPVPERIGEMVVFEDFCVAEKRLVPA